MSSARLRISSGTRRTSGSRMRQPWPGYSIGTTWISGGRSLPHDRKIDAPPPAYGRQNNLMATRGPRGGALNHVCTALDRLVVMMAVRSAVVAARVDHALAADLVERRVDQLRLEAVLAQDAQQLG